MLPAVALVGRPNVGKSTLFNAITNTRDALVADEPGVTRDRHYGVCRTAARAFVVVDTGGLTDDRGLLAELTVRQSLAAVDEAAVAVFVVDAKDGMTAADETILAQLRRYGRPIILAVNKTDGRDLQDSVNEFSALGLARVLPMAASHRRGVPELLEAIDDLLPEEIDAEELPDEAGVRVAIIGRPNVGKSTLVNRLLGEERVIASEVPGTTRDAIHVPFERDGRRFELIDTAGLRRKGKVFEAIEKFSVIKTLQAIADANVVLLLIDATQGVSDQDAHIAGYILDSGRAVVVAINKWDATDDYQRETLARSIETRLAFLKFAPVLHISAIRRTGLSAVWKAILQAHASATIKMPTPVLTRLLHEAVDRQEPKREGRFRPKLRYAHQGGMNPPRIVIHGNSLEHVTDSYKRYLEGRFREHFKLVGTPLRIEMRSGTNPFDEGS